MAIYEAEQKVTQITEIDLSLELKLTKDQVKESSLPPAVKALLLQFTEVSEQAGRKDW